MFSCLIRWSNFPQQTLTQARKKFEGPDMRHASGVTWEHMNRHCVFQLYNLVGFNATPFNKPDTVGILKKKVVN